MGKLTVVLLCASVFCFIAVNSADCSSRIWFKPIKKKLRTRLVHDVSSIFLANNRKHHVWIHCISVFFKLSLKLGPWISWTIRIVSRDIQSTFSLFQAYYAKCLIACPLPDMSCPKMAYGAGLSYGAAQGSAAYYASSKGHYNCGRYLGKCVIVKYNKCKYL